LRDEWPARFVLIRRRLIMYGKIRSIALVAVVGAAAITLLVGCAIEVPTNQLQGLRLTPPTEAPRTPNVPVTAKEEFPR